MCCGTKRLTEIRCPRDCPYLATAREHPPAISLRKQQRDVALLIEYMRDFNEQQSQLFFMTSAFLVGYQPSEFQPVIDDDVAQAAGALAATFETAGRGVIYEHRPTSAPAEHLSTALKALFAEAGGRARGSFERDAAVVLRRIETAVSGIRKVEPEGRRPLLDLLGRMIRNSPGDEPQGQAAPRLIVP